MSVRRSICLGFLAIAFHHGGISAGPPRLEDDSSSYRSLVLDNGLRALLVSDPSVTTAAFSVDFAVGNADNPPGWDGLAHYLEHVLVVGPGRRGVDGISGYTSFDHTSYQLVVRPGQLERALNRWGAMLERPSISIRVVRSELSSVEGEFRLAIAHEGRRTLEVLQTQMNPDHPYARFSQGNAASLGTQDADAAADAMKGFFEAHYTASNMSVAVVAPQSLHELHQWVTDSFADLPAGTPPKAISAPLFTPATLPRQLNLQPAGTLRQLQVLFPIPDPRPEYATKPTQILAQWIGDEGQGSLLGLLREEGLAEALSAGTTMSWRGGALFGVTIELTALGVDSIDTVLDHLFGALTALREAPPKETWFDETARMAELGYRYAETPEPRIRATTLAANLHDYPPDEVRSGPWLMTRYDPAVIERFMAPLRPDNALVMLTAPGLPTDLKTEQHRVPYAVVPVPDDRLATWQAARPEPRLTPLQPNPWIPGERALDVSAEAPPSPPRRLIDRPSLQAWFAPGTTHGQPRGAIDLLLRGPAIESAEQEAHLNLYTALLADRLAAPAYPALKAGIQQGVSVDADGLALRVRGFSPRLAAFVVELWQGLNPGAASAGDFERVREALIADAMARRDTAPAARQALDDLDAAILPYRHGPGPVATALRTITPEAHRAWQDRFWRQATGQLLVSGNLTREDFDTVAEAIQASLSPAAAPSYVPTARTLPRGRPERLDESGAGDTAVAWYIQGGVDKKGAEHEAGLGNGNGDKREAGTREQTAWRTRALMALSAELLRPRMLSQLRDRQQIGYLLDAYAWPQGEVPGLVALVQSPDHAPDEVLEALASVLNGLDDGTSRSEFDRRKTLLLQRLRAPLAGVSARADALWSDLLAGNTDFDTRERLADAIESMTRDAWKGAYRDFVLENPRALQVTRSKADQ